MKLFNFSLLFIGISSINNLACSNNTDKKDAFIEKRISQHTQTKLHAQPENNTIDNDRNHSLEILDETNCDSCCCSRLYNYLCASDIK